MVSDHSPPQVKILTKDLRSKYDVHYPNINVFHRQNIENFFLGGPPPLPTPNGKFRLKLTMKNDVDFPSKKKKNYGKNTENRKIFLFWSTLPWGENLDEKLTRKIDGSAEKIIQKIFWT